MKKVISIILTLLLVLCFSACDSGSSANDDFLLNPDSGDDYLSEFHDKVSESQELLDAVADDIYSNWHGAIYDDDFYGDINRAIAAAQLDHAEDIEKIESLDSEIAELFKKVKDGDNSELVKNVMSAYSDYYEFVVNVSGSFNSYSADKETLKKELASLLRDLSYEL